MKPMKDVLYIVVYHKKKIIRRRSQYHSLSA